MKRLMILCLAVLLVLGFSTIASAKNNNPGPVSPPTWDTTCSTVTTMDIDADGDGVVDPGGDDVAAICFGWSTVTGAKYSIDIEVPLDLDEDCGTDDGSVEFSWGTSDSVELGAAITDSEICIPVSWFAYDDDGDPLTPDVQLTGDNTCTASAKVKSLMPGKGGGRQNNLFTSTTCDFTLPTP